MPRCPPPHPPHPIHPPSHTAIRFPLEDRTSNERGEDGSDNNNSPFNKETDREVVPPEPINYDDWLSGKGGDQPNSICNAKPVEPKELEDDGTGRPGRVLGVKPCLDAVRPGIK